MLRSLRYSYVTSSEELPGLREITIVASDGIYSATISVFVDVRILNNNSPGLSFVGQDSVNFIEGSSPLPIGTLSCIKSRFMIILWLFILIRYGVSAIDKRYG